MNESLLIHKKQLTKLINQIIDQNINNIPQMKKYIQNAIGGFSVQESAWEMFRRLKKNKEFIFGLSDKLKCDDDLDVYAYILCEDEQEAIQIMIEIEKEMKNEICDPRKEKNKFPYMTINRSEERNE